MFDEANFDSLIEDHEFDHVLPSPKNSISPRSFTIGHISNSHQTESHDDGNISDDGYNGTGSKRSLEGNGTVSSSDTLLAKRNRSTDLHVSIVAASGNPIYMISPPHYSWNSTFILLLPYID